MQKEYVYPNIICAINAEQAIELTPIIIFMELQTG